jgi:phage head-tail adaptor, putative, SPP1 family
MSRAAGEYSRKIKISKRDPGVDAANQPLDNWLLVLSPWAKPRGATGMGAVRSAMEGVDVSTTMYSFRINYRPAGIDTGMRLEDHGTFYDIRKIVHDVDKHEWTDLVCEAGGNNG